MHHICDAQSVDVDIKFFTAGAHIDICFWTFLTFSLLYALILCKKYKLYITKTLILYYCIFIDSETCLFCLKECSFEVRLIRPTAVTPKKYNASFLFARDLQINNEIAIGLISNKQGRTLIYTGNVK